MLEEGSMGGPVLSIVAPAYNEEKNLPAFIAAIIPVLEAIGETFEIVFVDDGSRDDTLGMLLAARTNDPRIKVVSLARNFGKDVALTAGLFEEVGRFVGYRWLMRRVFRSCEAVIANSKNTQRILREEWELPDERVRVLHPGVDTERFTPAAPDVDFRRGRGWEGRAVVLTVGRLQKRKGHDMMIRALPALRRAVPNVLYAIGGDGEERESLRRLVDEEGVGEQVQFLGELGDRDVHRGAEHGSGAEEREDAAAGVAQRDVEFLAGLDDHRDRRPGTPGLDEAQVPGGDAALEGRLLLRQVPLPAPVPDQVPRRSSGGGLGEPCCHGAQPQPTGNAAHYR